MKPEYYITKHARDRSQQRGLRPRDLDLILSCATQVARNTFLMTRRDVAREIKVRKRELQRLEHLKNVKVVLDGDVIITNYWSRTKDQKRTMRRGRSQL